MIRRFLNQKYVAMKQEQMNRLYTRLSNDIGRPSKGLWRKKKSVSPVAAANQPSRSPNELSYNQYPKAIRRLFRPSLKMWKKSADDDDQLMDIWKSGFRFKRSV